MRTLEINPRFRQYFSELDYGQEQSLERSMKADLTSEPVLWWNNPETNKDEILDGHHRYKIAVRCKLELSMHEKHFDCERDALIFIIRHQTTRRNLDAGFRTNALREAVKLEIERDGVTQTDAIKQVAEDMNVSARTVYRALEEQEEPNPVEKFKQAKAELERNLTRDKTKAVERFKVQALKENLDEDEAQNKWLEIEETIDKTYADEIAELETLADHAQQAIEDNPGLKNTGPRTTKKTTKAKAARRNTFKKALMLMDKLTNEAFYFWSQNGCDDVSIDAIKAAMRVFADQIAEAQAQDKKDAKKKSK